MTILILYKKNFVPIIDTANSIDAERTITNFLEHQSIFEIHNI